MADKIVAEYTVKVDKAIKDLEKLAARVDKVDNERKKTEAGFKEMSKSMTSSFSKVGAAIGLAFGTQQLISFGKEAVQLAARAEGIRSAFNRLNNPNLLANLRAATRGTVTDLQLMQSAVRASNFKVPLEQLATFFEFATKRAIQTGESVDYLVNSIIDGIGRKSTLVLDNLGISATELQEEIKKVGDFGAAAGNIIARELEKAGDVADTTATKLARLDTTLENLKTTLGELLINSGDFLVFLDDIANVSNRSNVGLDNYAKRAAEAGMATKELALARGDEIGAVERYRILLFGLTEAQREEIRLSRESKELSEDEYVTLTQLNALYSTIDENQQAQIRNLAFLNAEIKKLNDERLSENTTLERTAQINKELIDLERERGILLGQLRIIGGAAYESIAQAAQSSKDVQVQTEQTLSDDLISETERREKEIADIKEQYRKWDLEAEQLANQQRIDAAMQIVDSIASIASSISQIQQNAFIQEQALLKKSLEEGLITREEYEQQELEIRRKQAQSAKDAAYFQAIIGTAQAVVQALANTPPPYSYVLAGIAAAAGAAQVAAIASQPLPQFAEGGFVNEHGQLIGRKHSQGGIHIEAEGGEFITSAKHAKQNSEILKAINSGDWEKYKMENIIAPAIEQVLSGGFENIGASFALNNQFNDRNLLRGLDRNRQSERDGFIYLGKKIDGLRGKGNRWN